MARKGQEGVPEGYKRCSKCGEVKSVGEFYVKMARCKKCFGVESKKRYEKNKEKIRNNGIKYRLENIELIKERKRIYRQKNKETLAEKNKEYRKKNFNKYKKTHALYYQKNRDVWLEYARNNRENSNINASVRYTKNPELYIAKRFFAAIGIKKSDVPCDIFDAKVLQIKLIRAIKAQKEGHKEVTNG